MYKTYTKVLISGNKDYVRGFLEGFLAGRNLKSDIFFGEDLNLSVQETKSIIAHLVDLEEERSFVVMEALAFGIVEEEIDKGHIKPAFEIIKTEPFKEAQFDFSIHTFSQDTGQEIKDLINQYSSKIDITPTSPIIEKVLPEGKGIEAYAPLHDYELLYRGHAKGLPGEILNFALKLNRYEVVTLENWKFTNHDQD
ncbi:MAG: hypothetical protein N2317_01120 [Syntrophales bacterium]|nr:hypothetical protein [Syntrophales bacterium]